MQMARTKNTSMFNRAAQLLFGTPPPDGNAQSVEQQQEEDMADETPQYEFMPPPTQPAIAAAQQTPVAFQQQPPAGNVPCPQCGTAFGTLRGMRIHRAKHQQTPKSPQKMAGTSTRPKLLKTKSVPTPKVARKKRSTPSASAGFRCGVCDKVLAQKRTWTIHEERCRRLNVQLNTIGIRPNNANATPPAVAGQLRQPKPVGTGSAPTIGINRNNANAATTGPNTPTVGHLRQPKPIGVGTVRPPTASPKNHGMSLGALINQKMTPRFNRSGLDLDQQPCSSAQARSHQQQTNNYARSHQIQQPHPASSSTPTTTMDENDGTEDEVQIVDVKPQVIGIQQQRQQNQWAMDLARLAWDHGREVQMTTDRRGKLVVSTTGSTERTAPAAPQNQHAAEPRQEAGGVRRSGGMKMEQN